MKKPRTDTIPERLLNGLVTENPVLVLMLGLTPALAVTKTAFSALGMGLATLVVLVLSNIVVSLLQSVIPARFRTVIYLMVAAAFVTATELVISRYIPALAGELGIYLPLIAVNCLVLRRMRAYADHKNVLLAFFDGLGMGLGFTLALFAVGFVREILAEGVFVLRVLSLAEAWRVFNLAPTAFFSVAFAVALGNKIRLVCERRRVRTPYENGCTMACADCGEAGCRERVLPTDLASNKELGAFIVKQCRRAAAFVWAGLKKIWPLLKKLGALLKRFGIWLWGQMKKLPPLVAKIKEGIAARRGDRPRSPAADDIAASTQAGQARPLQPDADVAPDDTATPPVGATVPGRPPENDATPPTQEKPHD
ncbi:MAG: hypothetical protein LBI54_10440 [Lachnospiraceae bacterium]|jgi:electron transport complex protein RnfE|nr:hypothetical protein [Lachnospiraceae bacterium]